LLSDSCGPTDVAKWAKARDAQIATRDELLQQLADSGCQWPADLEEDILATDALVEEAAQSWPDPGPLLARMFGTETGENYLQDWVTINIELLTRISCQVDRLGNLQGAQCEGVRPPVPSVVKLSAWPWVAGALAVLGVVVGVRLSR